MTGYFIGLVVGICIGWILRGEWRLVKEEPKP
jgi:hypothetical protein